VSAEVEGDHPVVAVDRLTKEFPGQVALDRVTLAVLPGEIHGLVGENGSGKSTLIKCLGGYYQPDGGTITMGDLTTAGLGAGQASRLGMRFIHQDPAIFPSLTVRENLAIDGRLMGDLSPAQRTMVAVARALQARPGVGLTRLLVLDEPTAALPGHEVQSLFEVIRAVASRGVGIIYVSHRIEEIFALTRRVSVLRDGQLIWTGQTTDLDEPRLVHLIAGEKLESSLAHSVRTRTTAAERLRVEGLAGRRLKDVSFSIAVGEVVGLAGLLGSGRSELARSLFGEQQARSGRVLLDGEPVAFRNPREAIAAGVALVPEDRRGQSAFGGMTMRENVSIVDLSPLTRAGRVVGSADRREAEHWMEEFDIRPRMPERLFGHFSGGNQQKAVLARWVRQKPRLMILDEPTQGVDVAARAEIYALIERLSVSGLATLFISSDAAELKHVCHRVLVLRHGRVAASLSGDELAARRIVELSFLDVPADAAVATTDL
jgi:ABC-type sugar transport system ATPase subunit